MAQSYDRRINLYINVDGKEVKNNATSIKAELQKITNQQALMTIGSKEYIEQARKIQQLKGVLAEHRDNIKETQKSWSFKGMADGFNRYMGIATAFAASAAGVLLSFKQIVQSFNDYQEQVSNLSALTGLTGDDLEWLSNKAKELSTSTLEGGIRIKSSAQDIVEAFTKMGSARPELLKNKEALAQVTQQALILAEAGKLETSVAIDAVAAAMNQFNLDATQSVRIINALAAGSLEGSAEIADLTGSLKNVGTVAASSNMTLEETVAALEVMAEKQLKGEEAGTKLRGALLKMKDAGVGYASGKFVFVDALTEINEKLAQQGSEMERDALKAKIFGIENVTAGSILIQNVGRFNELTTAVTGTNVAMEQAITNTDNNNAKLAQAKNKLNVMSIELGEKLAPALQVSTNGLSYLIKAMTVSIDFFVKYKGIIVTTVATITAYTLATKMAVLWEERSNKTKLLSIAIGKLQALAYRAQFAGIALYNAGVALLSGNMAVASVQARAFTAALMANPIGLIVGGIVAIGTAMYFMTGKATAAQKAQKMLNDVNLEAQKNIVEEKINIQTLLDIARNEKLTKDQRIKAIQTLNSINPQYINGLTLENIHTKKADDAVKAYTESLLENARAQAAKEKLIEIEKELLDLQNGNGAGVSFWQGAWNAMKSGGNMAAAAAYNAATATKNMTEKQEELTAQREKLLDITRKQTEAEIAAGAAGGGGGNQVKEDLIKLKEKELQAINDRIASTPAEIAARNREAEAIQNQINKLRELGTTKGQKTTDESNKENYQKALTVLDEANNERMARLVIQYEREGWTDEQFKAQQLAAELSYLTLKKALLEQFGQSSIQTEAQISQKRIDMQKSLNDVLSDGEKQLMDDLEKSMQADNEAIQASIDASDKVLDQVKKQKDDEKQILEERKQAYVQFAMAVGQSFGDLMMDQEATFGDYLRNTILMALEAFHQWFLIEKAKKIIEGISGGPVKIAIAIAKVAAMEIAYQGVRAAVMSTGKKKTAGYATGGYAYEEQYIVSEENKPEWIAPNWMLQNPFAASIIANLEQMRRNRYTVYPGAVSVSRSLSTPGAGTSYSALSNQQSSTLTTLPSTSQLTDATVREMIDVLKDLRKWKPKVYTELIKKDLETLDEIEQNRGL